MGDKPETCATHRLGAHGQRCERILNGAGTGCVESCRCGPGGRSSGRGSRARMSEHPQIEIAGRKIGAEHAPYVICELSGNHNGSLDRALLMVDAAADTGCDAIKIQTYTADTITLDVDRPEFRIHGGLWDGRTLYELYEEAQTPFEWHAAIFERARACGVTIFSSPFDETAVDLLDSLGAPAFKIASFEAPHPPLINYPASKGKPLIISTGMANLQEMQTARDTALAA